MDKRPSWSPAEFWLLVRALAERQRGAGALVALVAVLSGGARLPAAAQDGVVKLELAYWSSDPGTRFFRAVGELVNADSQTREGITTRWNAYLDEGALVASHPPPLPRLPAGMRFPYVAGAGSPNLTGRPARGAFTLLDPGRPTEAPGDLLAGGEGD